jgi:RNA polymerase sigma factor (sigma-70 family)
MTVVQFARAVGHNESFVAMTRRVLARNDVLLEAPHAVLLQSFTVDNLLSMGARSTDPELARLSLDLAAEWFNPYVRVLLHQIGLRGDDIDDATQQVFLSLPSALAGLAPGEPRKVSGWLAARARYVCLEQRRAQEGSRRKDGTRTRGIREDLKALDDIVGITPDYLADLVRGERVERVKQAIAQLPATDRRIVLGVLVEDQSHQEVASALGLTIAACKMRLSRARKALREAMGAS